MQDASGFGRLVCGPDGRGPFFLADVPVEDGATIEVRHAGGWLRGHFQASLKVGSRHRLIVEAGEGVEPLEVLLPADCLLRWPGDPSA